jgi:hypothetical protein
MSDREGWITPTEQSPEKKPKDLRNAIIMVLAALLIITLMWTVSRDLDKDYTAPNITTNLSQAYTAGIISTINQVLNSTNDCQIVRLNYINTTRDLVDVVCVEQVLLENNITRK